MSEVLLEVSQKIVILLVECSPKELVCCKNSYFPVLFFLRRVLLKLGGSWTDTGTGHQLPNEMSL